MQVNADAYLGQSLHEGNLEGKAQLPIGGPLPCPGNGLAPIQGC